MIESTRGRRSKQEIEILSKTIRDINCLPKLSPQDLSQLANEIDFAYYNSKTILFLQVISNINI